MKQELTGWQRTKAMIAKWIVVNIACRISLLAVLSLCLEVSRTYYESMEIDGE
jgi:hypothetical protein